LADSSRRLSRIQNVLKPNDGGRLMVKVRCLPYACLLLVAFSAAEQIPVRHPEGVAFGFLVLRSISGEPVAYGELKQVVKEAGGPVMDDLQFHFRDGSYYREITKFTQENHFRLISDQVEQKGPSFKKQSTSLIDAASGTITVRTMDKGKEKESSQHLDLPEDVANGLFMILVKNTDPSAAQTTVSMVAASEKPKIVKINITPGPEKPIKVGLLSHSAQHYVLKVKIEGVAGVVAPLVGKQPPDIHIWIVKSEAPTFLEYEGPLSQDSPVWRIELISPGRDTRKTKLE
jgi:hypothetical protein